MASKPVYTVLCAFAMVIGFLTFVFGMIDRIGIQMQISFLMLPVWNGMLFGTAGLTGLIIGRQNKRQGYISSAMTSGVKAINMLCFGLSLLSFYMYGNIVMYIGFRIEFEFDSTMYYPTRTPVLIPKLPSTMDGTPDDDTRQGIFAMIILFSLIEMFIGGWIIMLEKEKMILGSSTSSDEVPLVTGDPNQYVQPAQYAQPRAGMVVAPPQVQQQQQPVYLVAPGGNAPLPAAPINQQQQQQQPSYVVLQSSAMPTNQPQVIQRPQPQYVVLQNQVPNAPPAQHGDDEMRTTDSPAPQAGDVHSSDGIQQQRSNLKD